MDGPRVTVLMATYNAAEHIGQAIQSVLDQTYQHFELLVVDDGSTDATAETVRCFADGRIRLVSLKENTGAGAARNHGMSVAKTDLIAILDADDIAYPTRLERQVAYMECHPQCNLLGSAFDVLDVSGGIQRTVRSPCETALIRWCLLTRNVIANSTVMLRRDEALAVGGFAEDLRYGEDYSLWVAMAPLTEVAQLPEVLVAYRGNPSGLSRAWTHEHQLESIRTTRNALSRAAGREVSEDAAACLCGLPPSHAMSASNGMEAASALADALKAMVTCDRSAHGLEPTLLRDWLTQVERLCAIAPSIFPFLVVSSVRLSLATTGIRGLGAGYPTWLWRSFAFSTRSHLRRIGRAHHGGQD